jgi:hypothetical protein
MPNEWHAALFFSRLWASASLNWNVVRAAHETERLRQAATVQNRKKE